MRQHCRQSVAESTRFMIVTCTMHVVISNSTEQQDCHVEHRAPVDTTSLRPASCMMHASEARALGLLQAPTRMLRAMTICRRIPFRVALPVCVHAAVQLMRVASRVRLHRRPTATANASTGLCMRQRTCASGHMIGACLLCRCCLQTLMHACAHLRLRHTAPGRPRACTSTTPNCCQVPRQQAKADTRPRRG